MNLILRDVRRAPSADRYAIGGWYMSTCHSRPGTVAKTKRARVNVTILSDVVNNVVVHSEGRQYPGMVVQGDRLHRWLALAQWDTANDRAILRAELKPAVAELDRVSGVHGLLLPGPHQHPSGD